jgi:hypothetical protein
MTLASPPPSTSEVAEELSSMLTGRAPRPDSLLAAMLALKPGTDRMLMEVCHNHIYIYIYKREREAMLALKPGTDRMLMEVYDKYVCICIPIICIYIFPLFYRQYIHVYIFQNTYNLNSS